MGKRSPQTFAKFERERAVREKRERKQEKKAAAAAARAEQPVDRHSEDSASAEAE